MAETLIQSLITSFTNFSRKIDELIAVVKSNKPPEYKSIPYARLNVVVPTKLMVLDNTYSGVLAEVLFLSKTGIAINHDYSVRIVADGQAIYNDKWDNYEIFSTYLTDMTSADDGTYYMLLFNNIFFEYNITVEVYNANGVKFDLIWVKAIKRMEADVNRG